MRAWGFAGVLLCLGMLAGCQTAYYTTMEKLGFPKRDILVDRVEEARDAQEDAKEQFASALEEFSSVLNFDGGTLQDKYESLGDTLAESEARAEDVHTRIAAVESVSEALFAEWSTELGQYSDPQLRRSSEQKLRETRRRYDQMLAAMHRAEDKMEPVLRPLRDQVLYLKHNLNAQAIASIENELVSMEDDVAALVREMEAAIAEANQFIAAMGN